MAVMILVGSLIGYLTIVAFTIAGCENALPLVAVTSTFHVPATGILSASTCALAQVL
jgi:hypothetical protein